MTQFQNIPVISAPGASGATRLATQTHEEAHSLHIIQLTIVSWQECPNCWHSLTGYDHKQQITGQITSIDLTKMSGSNMDHMMGYSTASVVFCSPYTEVSELYSKLLQIRSTWWHITVNHLANRAICTWMLSITAPHYTNLTAAFYSITLYEYIEGVQPISWIVAEPQPDITIRHSKWTQVFSYQEAHEFTTVPWKWIPVRSTGSLTWILCSLPEK